MGTKFILHGGRLKLDDKRNDGYFRELTKDLDDGDRVLLIGFARLDKVDRAEVYKREKGYILAQTNKNIEVINANHNDLIEQIKEVKAIHITGGETSELVKDIRRYPDFTQSLEGKVVGGSSAGACLFSTYYYTNDQNAVLEGLGTLPIRLLVHYGNPEFGGTETSLDLLKAYSNDLELIALSECNWIVKEK